MATHKPTRPEILQQKFEPNRRFHNFGEVIVRMRVNGFRCHRGTEVDIRSPVTAICGPNGTGKSTLLQLAAVAYTGPDGAAFKLTDFFARNSELDRTAFSPDTFVRYDLWQPEEKIRSHVIRRNRRDAGWDGYRDRPVRRVYLAGVMHYVPLWEGQDFRFRNAERLTVASHTLVAHKRTSEILDLTYDKRTRHTVRYRTRSETLLSVARNGAAYSETNMGFGEARVQMLLDDIEQLPNKCLVLLEEPETSLHPAAQARLGEYLVDLALEKGHQVLVTTHSDALMQALPPQSVVYLHPTPDGATPLPGVTPAYARCLLADGETKALTVLVEDVCAKYVLEEIVRLADNQLLRAVSVVPAGCRNPDGSLQGGGKDAIRQVMDALRQSGLKIVAVLDGDEKDNPAKQVFKLPGTRPPEDEMFDTPAVERFLLGQNVTRAKRVELLKDEPHQRYFEALGRYINKPGAWLQSELARVYAEALPDADRRQLADQIRRFVR
jgi:predicted ATPase